MNKLLTCFCILLYTSLSAQEPLSLEAYINSVLEKNPAIRQSDYARQTSRADQRQSIWNFAPSVEAQLNVNKIYGTAFDNVTFQRVQKATTNIFPSLNLNVTLFDGLINVWKARYATLQDHTARYQQGLTRALQVTQAVRLYCQYLVSQQNTLLFQSRQQTLEKLLRQKKIEAENGSVSQAALLAVVAQYEMENAGLLDAQLKEQNAQRDLYAFMLQKADTGRPVAAVLPDVTVMRSIVEKLDIDYAGLRSRSRQDAQLMAANLRWQALSRFSPRLYLSASLASSYSSNGIIDYNTGTISYPNYGTQFRLNSYQFVGLTLSVPVFVKMQRLTDLQKTGIGNREQELKNAEENLADENTRTRLRSEAQVLEKRHRLLQASSEAATIAFREQEMKFGEGHTDFYTYMNAMNARDAARLELLKNQVEILVNAVEKAFWGIG